MVYTPEVKNLYIKFVLIKLWFTTPSGQGLRTVVLFRKKCVLIFYNILNELFRFKISLGFIFLLLFMRIPFLRLLEPRSIIGPYLKSRRYFNHNKKKYRTKFAKRKLITIDLTFLFFVISPHTSMLEVTSRSIILTRISPTTSFLENRS